MIRTFCIPGTGRARTFSIRRGGISTITSPFHFPFASITRDHSLAYRCE